MKPYTPEHQSHLLTNLPAHLPPSLRDELARALDVENRERYLSILECSKYFCACALCELPTDKIATRRCNVCWELEHRISLFLFKRWSETDAGSDVLKHTSALIQKVQAT